MLIFFPFMVLAESRSDAFIIQINDRSMSVVSPDKLRPLFAVVVENRSLSDQVGKFTIKGKIVKFVSILSGKSETVEIENKSNNSVVFVPVAPAFQDVELKFGKKAYEIPSKE
ncbi:MAG TPA: hypothetical protein VNJ08_05690 [Bacteriovoracaceae bacterium]|nr:hypothetical protein [Bacteriovoracaceae bacterium]